MVPTAPVAVRFQVRCHWRPMILAVTAAVLLTSFWVFTRYPQLFEKSGHVGEALPSMAYTGHLMAVPATSPVWYRIVASAVNWLDGMKVGMTFGVLLGALLHTVLKFYPLKIGNNLYVNSLKGALVGVPMGVCANCAVPTACGITRGKGRVEVALGFLFSSPNFNPVVVTMTLGAFPLGMVVVKYALLLGVILVVVPSLIRWLERGKPLGGFGEGDDAPACSLDVRPSDDCTETFGQAVAELSRSFGRHAWMLVKPTATLMLLASLASATALVLVPWDALLAHATPGRLALASLLSTAMPVPIALDVMFAAQLQHRGVAPGYVMLFLTTLGTFSVIPLTYLWREVSRPLAVSLFGLFAVAGLVVGLVF